jgi:hypothetical protein
MYSRRMAGCERCEEKCSKKCITIRHNSFNNIENDFYIVAYSIISI